MVISSQDSTKVKEEFDLDLLAFIERYATNQVRWDVVIFFGHNPHAKDAAAAIAQCIDGQAEVVYRELEELVILGLLEQEHINSNIVYRLTSYTPLRQAALHFVSQIVGKSDHLNEADSLLY